MNNNENAITNFANTLRNHNAQRPVLLYSENKNEGTSEQKCEIKDVISGVANQLKAIQNADNVRKCSKVRSNPNVAKKSNFSSDHKLPVEQQKQIQSHKFETQCVLDTQLIYVIENAEANIDAGKGITQEFNTTFCHKDEDNCNNKPVNDKVLNIILKTNNNNTENKSIELESNVKNVMLSNSFDDDNIEDINNVEYGMTQEFDTTFCHKDQGHNDDDKTHGSLKQSNVHTEELIIRTDSANKSDTQNLNLRKDLNAVNQLNFQEKYVNNTTINNLASTENEYGKFDSQSNIFFDNCEDKNNNYNLHEKNINSVENPPKSPILNKIQTKPKSKTPSPLIFKLELFEKFESMALPIIENYDVETARRVINSQNFSKELFIHTNYPCNVLHDRDKNVQHRSPIFQSECSDKQTINQSDMIEDNMLFNSDEDEVLNYLEELPSTSSLNNSPDSEPEIIDKIMHVGFQTASNKSIQVCSNSYSKAKTIFDNITNIDNEEVSETRLLSSTGGENSFTITNQHFLVNSNNAINANDGEIKVSFNTPNIVFNDNKIKNSPKMPNEELKNEEKHETFTEYLQIDNYILEEFNKDLVINTNIQSTKSDQNEVSNAASCSELMNVINKEPVLDMKPSNNDFVGFRKANNKMIKISAHALDKTKNIFNEIDNDDILLHKHGNENLFYKNNSNFVSDNKENEAQNNKISTPFEESRKIFINRSKPSIIASSNKSVFISKPTSSNIKTILQNVDISKNNKDVKDKESNDYKGFATSSNKPVVVSESALTKSNRLFQDIAINEEICDSNIRISSGYTKGEPDEAFQGFETASNKLVNISKKALAVSKKFIQDCDNNEGLCDSVGKIYDCHIKAGPSKPLQGFKNENNKPVPISESALARSKKILQDNDANLEICDVFRIPACDTKGDPHEVFQGFATASNKPVNISKKALTVSKQFIQDFDNNEGLCDGVGQIYDCHTKAGPSKPLQGFKTANNKPVAISVSALARSKKLFQDDDGNEEICDVFRIPACDTKGEPHEAFQGFATASNKPVNISEKALTVSKKFIQDFDNNEGLCDGVAQIYDCHTKAWPSKPLQGFKTANNKPVAISESALARSKKLFQDDDGNEEICDVFRIPACDTKGELHEAFQGFATASNKPVNISKKALTESKKFIQDYDNNEGLCDGVGQIYDCHTKAWPSKPLQGFKNANNKPVAISESALARSKKLFQDDDGNEEICDVFRIPACDTKGELHEAFQGFATASNKPVNISKKALTESKKFIQDYDNNEGLCDGVGQIYDCHTKAWPSKPLQGFKNANNKPVAISESALARSKKLFQDDDGNEEICDVFRIPACDTKGEPHEAFQGFATASNKPVNISEKALTVSKKFIQDFDNNEGLCDGVGQIYDCHTKAWPSKPLQGFKNANNKPVAISESALARSKKLFQDDDGNKEMCENVFRIPACDTIFNSASNNTVKISENSLLKIRQAIKNNNIDLHNENFDFESTSISSFAFRTASNTNINISEEALKKCKDLLTADSRDSSFEHGILEDFNTEMIKDFEVTFYTEDFQKNETPRSKRSGSPILSFPKKAKTFKTPIITKKFVAPIKSQATILANPNNQYIFNDDYKKNKKYTLKDINEIGKLSDFKNIDPYVLNFKLETLLSFEFEGSRNDIDSDTWTADKIKKFFENSVKKRLVPDGWIENHMKLIIWKLISYEIRFPVVMKNVCTVRTVLEQLKYRYKRELYNVERPALRKILERDEVSTRRIILCVAGIFVEGANLLSIPNEAQNVELLLTDGWYTVKATTDRMIARLVCDNKIRVGTKLVIHGAELMNCDQGIVPWEDTSLVRLKISGNSIRRARWDARLGFHGYGAILTRLSAVEPEGGKISHLRTLITRIYPTLYIEKFPDGSTLTRSERLEQDYQIKYETERQSQLEKLYDELEKFSDQESQDSEGLYAADRAMDSGSQISRLMKKSRDWEEFRANLTSSQACLLQQHSLKQKEKLLHTLQSKFQELVKKRGLDTPRNVVPLMKIRVADVEKGRVSKAMITVWKPSETIQDMLEGTWVDMYNVVATSVRYSEIQISAGRQSVFQRSKFKETDELKIVTQTLKRQCYTIKDLQNSSISTDYNEVDIVGLIFMIEPTTKEFEMKNQPFQNVYLADEDKNIISINFWGGIKKFGFQNILETGQIVACLNLQKRAGNTKKNIPKYRATEFSFFTKTSKMDGIRKMADHMAAKFNSLDKRKFIDDCVALKNNYHSVKCGNTSHISPYRLNVSDYNVYKNKAFIDSPLVKCTDVNLNLSGLDFDSSFKQVDTQGLSPQVLLRKQKVNEKIAKLKMYGEPPPLGTIHIVNKASAKKAFKSPFEKNDISATVANPPVLPRNMGEFNNNSECDETSEECTKKYSNVLCPNDVHKIDTSPIFNRSYVKRASINPVKLNFSNAIDTSAKDPFAEEFDGSLPLSLDVNFIT